MIRFRRKVALLILGLAGVSDTFGYLARGTINLHADVIQNRADGRYHVACVVRFEVDSTISHTWILGFTTPAASNSGDSQHGDPVLSCAGHPATPPAGDRGQQRAELGPADELKIDARVVRQGEDERVLIVTMYLDPGAGGAAAKEDQEQLHAKVSRQLTFPDDGVSFIPLRPLRAVSGDGIPHDSFLRLETSLSLDDRHSKFGAITVRSNVPGAIVLLDGGVVGQLSEDGLLAMNLVPPGYRKVSLHHASGRKETRFVRVKPSRDQLVQFAAAGSNDPDSDLFVLDLQGTNEWGYREYLRRRDTATMVEVPEGKFLMGNLRTERTPFEHEVYLATFLIDKTAVTWRQYKEFVEDTGIPMPPHKPYWGIHDDHPAVYVTWQESRSYCQWAGGRLPTEAEREKAARGTDERLYPWGEDPPTPDLGVFRRGWGSEATDPVGIRPLGASPYGVMDMGGNVWEWCADWYSDEYLESSPYENPPGPEYGTRYVLRGGSWDSRPDVLSASCRNWGHPGYREGDFGFRCAMSAPPR